MTLRYFSTDDGFSGFDDTDPELPDEQTQDDDRAAKDAELELAMDAADAVFAETGDNDKAWEAFKTTRAKQTGWRAR